jgi:hypothetical protein
MGIGRQNYFRGPFRWNRTAIVSRERRGLSKMSGVSPSLSARMVSFFPGVSEMSGLSMPFE